MSRLSVASARLSVEKRASLVVNQPSSFWPSA